MKTIKLCILCAIAILFLTTGCTDELRIRGNGIQATEGRITSDFNKVKSSGNFDVHITNGNENEVVVIAEENIIPYIETYVSGNTLKIEIRGLHSIKNTLPMDVYVTTPHLNGVKQSGSGIITTDYFYTDHFDVILSGSGNISTAVDAEKIDALISGSGRLELSGLADNGEFTISGSGRIDAFDLSLRGCDAKISGAGNMWVNVEQNIHAVISGSGSIYYYGTPDVETHISGSGNVIQEN